MAEAAGVLVVAETMGGKPAPIVLEVIGLARRLGGELGGKVTALVIGSGLDGAAAELAACGADQVLVADDPKFESYQADVWVPIAAKVAGGLSPRAILVGHTSTGADFGPRLAFRLKTAVATACVAAEVKDGKLMLTRPCYGGNAREVVSIKTSPSVATIKPKTQEAATRGEGAAGAVSKIDPGLAADAIRTKIVEKRQQTDEGAVLEKANVVVSGGRGLNGPEGFKLAAALAKLLGGAVGASRVAVDLGWCPASYQVGLSGRTVAPELYFALGISGAGQHMAGCAGAKNIVAINTDKDAQIFGFSRFGVIGECEKVLPPLIQEIGRIRKEALG